MLRVRYNFWRNFDKFQFRIYIDLPLFLMLLPCYLICVLYPQIDSFTNCMSFFLVKDIWFVLYIFPTPKRSFSTIINLVFLPSCNEFHLQLETKVQLRLENCCWLQYKKNNKRKNDKKTFKTKCVGNITLVLNDFR